MRYGAGVLHWVRCVCGFLGVFVVFGRALGSSSSGHTGLWGLALVAEARFEAVILVVLRGLVCTLCSQAGGGCVASAPEQVQDQQARSTPCSKGGCASA